MQPSSVVTTQALVNGALQSMVDTHGFMAAAAAQGAAHQGRNSIGFLDDPELNLATKMPTYRARLKGGPQVW